MLVTVQEMIDWLRAEPEDCYLIESLIEAAVTHVENETGMTLGTVGEVTQTIGGAWPLSLRGTPAEGEDFLLERWTGSAWETVDASAYYLDGAFVRLAGSSPDFGTSPRFRATYTTGYPDGQQPAPVQLAVKMLVGHWYENREAVVIAGVGATPHEVPMAVDRLLAPYRRVVV